MRNIITRSFVKNSCTATVYKDGKLSSAVFIIPCGYNDNDSAERYIRRNMSIDGKLVEVNAIEKLSALYGMEESEFINLATSVNERSKETRNAITKTIVTFKAKLVYMTPDRKIEDITINLPQNMGKKEYSRFILAATPKDCKPIELTDKEEVSTLYALDEQTFIANAREMSDHSHFKF